MFNKVAIDSKTSSRLFEGERWMVLTGLLGFVLAAICVCWILINGGPVAPNGDVSKAFSFNMAFGMFLLSTAAILPFSAMKQRSKALFRWSYIILALYAYTAENLQNFRGINPRFVDDGTSFDMLVAGLFGLVAMLLAVFYVFLAAQYFRRSSYAQYPTLILGIRYAMIAIMLSFAAGIWISMNEGRFTGVDGNIIWFHGLGFHAIQALPLVAWLVERTTRNASSRHRFIHLSGILYIIGLFMIGWQTMLGLSIFSWTILPIIAGSCFITAIIPAIILLRALLLRSRQALLNQRHTNV
jgi:hypothetical protein